MEDLRAFGDNISSITYTGAVPIPADAVEPHIASEFVRTQQKMRANPYYRPMRHQGYTLNNYVTQIVAGRIPERDLLESNLTIKPLVSFKLDRVFDTRGMYIACADYFISPPMVKNYNLRQLLCYAAHVTFLDPEVVLTKFPRGFNTKDDLYAAIMLNQPTPE